jgi:hypothetical protein
VLLTVACTHIPDPQDVQTTDVTAPAPDPGSSDDDDDNAAVDGTPSSDSNSKYGWKTPISAAGIKNYTLEEIVTSKSAIVRADKTACVTCHSWAAYQTRDLFCERVDSFLGMPTSTGNLATDPKNAKPETLKKILKAWKSAGCPD